MVDLNPWVAIAMLCLDKTSIKMSKPSYYNLPEIAINSDDFTEDILATEEGAEDNAGDNENIVDVVN